VSGDYLWDRSGPRDPEVVRLEQLLAPLGQSRPPADLRMPVTRRRFSAAFVVAVTAAASIVAAVVTVVEHDSRQEPPGFAVTTIAGSPTISARPVGENGRLLPGRWLETDASARASIDIADIGQVDLAPESLLRLVSSRPGDYRMHLRRGSLHARIWAPPGQFAVDTPTSTTVDLGCAYTLSVGDDGVGLVKVETGWVGFEWQGRESFIPAGAVCVTRPVLGPGTPYFDDVSPAFRSAIDVIDAGRPDAPDADARRQAAIALVLAEARDKDVVTLWHLLGRVRPEERDAIFDVLAREVAPPSSVTREGIRRGDRAMLDAWWDRLGLGTTTWWRTWKQQWRDRPDR